MGRIMGAAALLVVVSAGTAAAQGSSHTVNYTVNSINTVTVTGTPSLTITTTTAAVTDSASTYAVETNAPATSPKRIMAALDNPMEAGLTLQVELDAPSTVGTSAGVVTLSTTETEVVGDLSQVAESGLKIRYTLTATPAAAAGSNSKVVTYTIVDEI